MRSPAARSPLARVVVTLGLALVIGVGCTEAPMMHEERRGLFRAGARIAEINEITREKRAGGLQVERRIILASAPSDAILFSAYVDESGFLTQASYRREGGKGRRYVELVGAGGGRSLVSRGDGELATLPNLQLVATELVHLLKPRKLPVDVAYVDLATTEVDIGRVLADGTLVDDHGLPVSRLVDERLLLANAEPARSIPQDIPLPFAEGLLPSSYVLRLEGEALPTRTFQLNATTWDAPDETPDDRLPTPFIESRTPRIVAFARSHAAALPPLEAARALVDAIRPRIDAARAGGPPSAVWMERFGGGAEGGAALLAASLRAVGHAARPVVGYRWSDGALRPHTWVEVKTAAGWVVADAASGFVGASSAYVPLARSLGGPFSTGRAYGRVFATVVDAKTGDARAALVPLGQAGPSSSEL